MSIDLGKIKSRLNTLQNAQSSKSVMWKPVQGKQVIRIVPYKFNLANPFFEGLFYYNLGSNRTILSPATFGEADPVMDFANNLKKTGEKEDWRAAKRMEPKLRTYVPIIVRGEENEPVRFWGFGKTVYQELLAVIADPDYGDITDPMNGRDITLEYISAEDAGKNWPETRVRIKPNPSPLHDDSSKAKSFLENQQKIEDIWTVPTFDEMKKLLENWLNPTDEVVNSDDEDDDSTPVQSTKPKTSNFELKQNAPAVQEERAELVPAGSVGRASAVEQVSKDFDALFGD